MTDDQCPSCGQRIAAAVLAAGGPTRCPRCGDPLTITHVGATVTVAPAQPPADLGSTIAPGEVTAAHEPRPAAPTRLPTIPGYQLLEVIGRGGMGVVYKAQQLMPRRIVALKMILGGGRPERFQAEVAAVARLQHPNVVQIHEVGEAGGRPFFSMEYVPGGSLATHLGGGQMPTREAAEIVLKLARAVQHAHERGIVHRDLKPANILLAGARIQDSGSRPVRDRDRGFDSTLNPESRPPNPVPKIADFGLAKHLEGSADDSGPMTQSGAILGTPNYMAPEQAKGKSKQIGPATDIWALGAILYECLAGRPPFREDSHLDTMMKVISEEPDPPRQLRSAVPRDLEIICLKCLRKQPVDRYAAAKDLADDLERFLDGLPIKARSRTVRERVGGWVRRRRGLVYAGAGAALIAAVAAVALNRGPGKKSGLIQTDKPAAANLPADLRLVPPDVFGFVTLRAADLLKNPALAEMFGVLGRGEADFNLESLGKHVESVTSIPPANIERATFVLPTVRGDTPLVILSTIEPYSHDRLEALLARKKLHRPQDFDGKRMYVPINLQTELSFLPLSDRILVLGQLGQLQSLVRQPEYSIGPLTPVLENAALQHTLVVGANPTPDTVAAWLIGEIRLGPGAEAVARLRTIGVTLDVSQPAGPNRRVAFDVAGRITYPNGDQAEAARPHMQDLVVSVSERVVERSGLLPFELFRPLLAPVKAAQWQRDGDTLHATAQTGIDLTAAKTLTAELVARNTADNNMRKIATALHQYHQAHGRFPPAVITDADGKPLYSWRVELLPFLGEDALYRRFHLNRAWDHPTNRPLLDQMPAIFTASGAKGGNTTPYQALTGPGGLFDTPQGRTLKDVPDGTTNTILFVQAAKTLPWTQPVDLQFGTGAMPELGGVVPSGFHVAMADGSVHFFPHQGMKLEQLHAMFTRAGSEAVTLPP